MNKQGRDIIIHVQRTDAKVWGSWLRGWTLIGLALTLFAIASSTLAAPITPFTYVLVDIFAGGATDGTSVMAELLRNLVAGESVETLKVQASAILRRIDRGRPSEPGEDDE